ncbi:TonB-dependent receptor plug domain-containing protein [soil metagenome]
MHYDLPSCYFHYAKKLYATALLGMGISFGALAQGSSAFTPVLAKVDTLRAYTMPQVEILGQRDGLFNQIPGSAAYLSSKEIKLVAPVSGNEVFRRVLGLHVVEEEGLGLRTNIGIRGLDPDKSRSVLILEDGVPVALNPYGEPEMYYTPSMDRMAGVEVLKGSGQVLYGPQTIGGVINYITADPPETRSGTVRIRGGQGGFFSGLLGYGNTYGNTGFQVNYLRRQADNVGTTFFRVNDLTGKVKFQLSDRASLGLKLGVYDEFSNATYIGLTQTMYDRGGEDFTLMAPDDNLEVRRYSASLTHRFVVNENLRFTTTAFGYTTTRNWQRQDFSSSASATNKTGVVWGDPAVPGGAIYMRNSTGNRNRQFEVAGLEPRMSLDYSLGNLPNTLDADVRYMYERAFEQRVNGTKKDVKSGALVEDEIRTGYSASAFAQNKFLISEKFSLNAGVRLESFDFAREILRNSFVINGKAAVRDTSLIAESSLLQLIPGAGFNLNLNPKSSIFGGIHRGFAPPRVKDAITALGQPLQLDAELSWNTELGTRVSLGDLLTAEVTAFYMDFSNQVIPVSESSGGTGSGLVNGGRTLHRGLEVGADADFGKMLHSAYSLRLNVNTTLVDARYSGDRFLSVPQRERVNIKGNQTPYAPRVLVSSALTFEAPIGLGGRFTGTYTGKQFTDELNTLAPTPDGRIGQLDDFFILDALAYYRLPKLGTTFNLSVKNVTDERYVATRRPQGIRVGLPRFVTAGVEVNF